MKGHAMTVDSFNSSDTYEEICTWLIQAPPAWVRRAMAAGEDCEWYPDSPGDLVNECGANVVVTPIGWECENGHSHYSHFEYFEAEEVERLTLMGTLPANARYIDGSEIY
jgi:hypothetical protein